MARLWLAFLICMVASFLAGCGEESAACPEGCPSEACESDGNCATDQCTSSGECPDGLYCDTSVGWCRLGCESDQLCNDGRICDPATNRCIDCGPSNACPDDTGMCTDGRCVECMDDADCGLGMELYCSPGPSQCVEGCLLAQHCPVSLVCDSEAKRCVECVKDQDCGTGTCDTRTGVCE